MKLSFWPCPHLLNWNNGSRRITCYLFTSWFVINNLHNNISGFQIFILANHDSTCRTMQDWTEGMRFSRAGYLLNQWSGQESVRSAEEKKTRPWEQRWQEKKNDNWFSNDRWRVDKIRDLWSRLRGLAAALSDPGQRLQFALTRTERVKQTCHKTKVRQHWQREKEKWLRSMTVLPITQPLQLIVCSSLYGGCGEGRRRRHSLEHQKRSGDRTGEITGLTDAAHEWKVREGADI